MESEPRTFCGEDGVATVANLFPAGGTDQVCCLHVTPLLEFIQPNGDIGESVGICG